ncbi:MAG: NADPH-dependent F420 reductase [Chloroflexota bacterium]|nr:NADPH-dependent F420 reductase [Chloroflexota bacterium]
MRNDTAAKLPTIAILGGTGKEGPGLAMRWATVGYPIIIGSRKLEKAQATATGLNEKLSIDSITGLQNNEAARQADMCVLTVVASAHQAALKGLKSDLNGKILVDATARVEFRDPKPPDPPSAARIAQDMLGPETKVVAALQNVPAHLLKQNLGATIDSDVLVFADDKTAASEVIKLVRAGGMRAYYAGDLDSAIVAEGLTAVLIQMNKYYGVKTASIGINGLDV